MTINALSKSDSIQNLKITNLCRYLLFDSTKDPALLAGVDDSDDEDEDTSLAGVHDEDTSLAGVPVPNTTITTNADNDSDTKSNHNSVTPMRPNTTQAKHPAPEATYLFTIQLVNHHNILQMRKSLMT